MESGQLKSGSIYIFNLPTIFYQISNTPTTEYEMTLLLGHFSENITLKLHVTFCRTSRVISPKLCHALFSMSRVKSGEFCHGQCHALLFGQKRVTGYFSCHGCFFRQIGMGMQGYVKIFRGSIFEICHISKNTEK